jgi:hypothetical protein
MKKVLFYVLFAVVTFVVTLTLLSQRLDDNYMIERDVMIKAPIEKVYAEVGDLKKWPDWSPWKKHDPSIEYIFDGEKTTAIGDSGKWTSSKDGGGQVTITEASAPNVFSYKLKFDGWNDTPTGEFHLINMSDSVRVVWTMRGTRGFTDKIFWTLFKIEDTITGDFEEGLQLLKGSLESK